MAVEVRKIKTAEAESNGTRREAACRHYCCSRWRLLLGIVGRRPDRRVGVVLPEQLAVLR